MNNYINKQLSTYFMLATLQEQTRHEPGRGHSLEKKKCIIIWQVCLSKNMYKEQIDQKTKWLTFASIFVTLTVEI